MTTAMGVIPLAANASYDQPKSVLPGPRSSGRRTTEKWCGSNFLPFSMKRRGSLLCSPRGELSGARWSGFPDNGIHLGSRFDDYQRVALPDGFGRSDPQILSQGNPGGETRGA